MTIGPDFLKYIIVVILLGANAYFIRSLVQSINDVKLELGKLITEHSSSKEKLGNHAEDLKDLYRKTNDQEADLAVLKEQLKAANARLLTLESEKKDSSASKQEVAESISAIRERLHALEGRDAQFMAFIESLDKKSNS